MTYQVHEQYLDLASGFHVLRLKNEHGVEHIVQIAVGHDSCPACGAVHPKDSLGLLDPKALVAAVTEALDASHANMHTYAEKHGIPVK